MCQDRRRRTDVKDGSSKRRGRLACSLGAAATVALIAVVVAVAEPAPQPGSYRLLESWVDGVHGWRFAGVRDGAGFFPSIQSSDDGGRSWRTVYRSSLYGRVGTILRTSSTAGLATVSTSAGARTIVTLDGGKHWQRLARRFFWPSPYVDGAGGDLFVLGNPAGGSTKTTLYRVTNWPTVHPRLHVEVSAAGGFSLLHMVPGGVVALEGGGTSGAIFRLLIDRNGSVRVATPPSITTQGAVDCGVRSFSVSWPTLVVVTGWAPAGANACDDKQTAVVYMSDDGGRSWSLIGTPTATR
jgi:BNR/Asp-box repeat